MPDAKSSKRENIFWLAVGVLALLAKILYLYYTYWHRHFLAPPGNDVVVHYHIIEKIIQTGKLDFSIYPPGFHLLVIGASKIFHVGIWTVLTNWTPVLIILPSLAIYFLLRQLFSTKISIIASIVLLLASNYPLYAFGDGNFPDMLAYGVFTPLLFGFLLRYWRTKRWQNLIWAVLFLILIAFTHHFTFFNVLGILIIFGFLQLFLCLWQSPQRGIFKILWILAAIIFVLAIGYFLAEKLYGALAFNFIDGILKNQPFLKDTYLNTLPEYSDYLTFTGNLVSFFGLAGFIYLIASRFEKPERAKGKQLTIIWLLFFYLLSRLAVTGFPARFARELALPLVISMAYLFEYLFEKNLKPSRLGQIFALGLLGYLLVINSELYTGLDKFPNGFKNQIWYWPVDQAKVDYLKENVGQDQIILYNPSANLFFAIKTGNQIIPLKLSAKDLQVVDLYLAHPEIEGIRSNYHNLLKTLRPEYSSATYILDDVKPPSNPSSNYPVYAGFDEKKQILDDLAAKGEKVKSFPDGAAIYKLK